MSVQTETGTITLGERSFPVRAFTFEQLQVILPQLETAWTRPFAGEGVAAAREVIRTALSGQVTEEEFRLLVATVPQIIDALATVGRVSGLVALGEQVAQMAPSIGTGSMPPSAPTPAGTGTPSVD